MIILEPNLSTDILHSKLQALVIVVKNSKIATESFVLQIAEISNALMELQELLWVFQEEDSPFRRKHCTLRAIMYLHICAILKTICAISFQVKAFSSTNLMELCMRYQVILDWYRKRCIGKRLASCYVAGMIIPTAAAWTYDWNRLNTKYKHYFEVISERWVVL